MTWNQPMEQYNNVVKHMENIELMDILCNDIICHRKDGMDNQKVNYYRNNPAIAQTQKIISNTHTNY